MHGKKDFKINCPYNKTISSNYCLHSLPINQCDLHIRHFQQNRNELLNQLAFIVIVLFLRRNTFTFNFHYLQYKVTIPAILIIHCVYLNTKPIFMHQYKVSVQTSPMSNQYFTIMAFHSEYHPCKVNISTIMAFYGKHLQFKINILLYWRLTASIFFRKDNISANLEFH